MHYVDQSKSVWKLFAISPWALGDHTLGSIKKFSIQISEVNWNRLSMGIMEVEEKT
jgi:hypothetical protein